MNLWAHLWLFPQDTSQKWTCWVRGRFPWWSREGQWIQLDLSLSWHLSSGLLLYWSFSPKWGMLIQRMVRPHVRGIGRTSRWLTRFSLSTQGTTHSSPLHFPPVPPWAVPNLPWSLQRPSVTWCADGLLMSGVQVPRTWREVTWPGRAKTDFQTPPIEWFSLDQTFFPLWTYAENATCPPLLGPRETKYVTVLEHFRAYENEACRGGRSGGGTFVLWILPGLTWWGGRGGRWLPAWPWASFLPLGTYFWH